MSDANPHPTEETQSPSRDSTGTASTQCDSCPVAFKAGASYCPECGSCLTEHGSAPQAPETSGKEQSVPPPEPSETDAPQVPKDHAQDPAHGPSGPKDPPADADKKVSRCSCGAELVQDAEYCCNCGRGVKETVHTHALSYKGVSADLNLDMTGKELTVGKSADCTLRIQDDDYVSRRHARLFLSDGTLHVEDLGSSNGTFLRVRKPLVLEPGDEILVGRGILRVERNHS